MKRIVCGILAAIVMTGNVFAQQVPNTSAASTVLMDADSGRVLYSHNADEPRLIASITKLMTALVALESGHALDEVVTIQPEWTGIEGSSLYLKPDEKITLETLLYGLMLRSGNDAAHAIAGYCGGDMEHFVHAMNEKAHSLGMTNSHFSNPSGLNAEDHYATARDMAILARACLQNETLRKIVSTRSVTLEGRIFTNHNKLLWQYEGCIGLKTGYTEKAGRTLVSAASRDGMTLICVTLNAPDDWRDHRALFDYGFQNYERRCLVKTGETLCQIPVSGSLIPFCMVRAQEDVYAALKPEEQVEISFDMVHSQLRTPLSNGESVGTAVFLLNGQPLYQLPLRIPHKIRSDSSPKSAGLAQFFGR